MFIGAGLLFLYLVHCFKLLVLLFIFTILYLRKKCENWEKKINNKQKADFVFVQRNGTVQTCTVSEVWCMSLFQECIKLLPHCEIISTQCDPRLLI